MVVRPFVQGYSARFWPGQVDPSTESGHAEFGLITVLEQVMSTVRQLVAEIGADGLDILYLPSSKRTDECSSTAEPSPPLVVNLHDRTLLHIT